MVHQLGPKFYSHYPQKKTFMAFLGIKYARDAHEYMMTPNSYPKNSK